MLIGKKITSITKSEKIIPKPFIFFIYSINKYITYIHLLFIKVNPKANCCPRFNLTLMLNFTVLPLFNY